MVNQTIPVHGISKLWLEVRQLGRAIHFYRDVLRLPLVGPDGDIACFDVDGQQIALTKPQVFPESTAPRSICTGLHRTRRSNIASVASSCSSG